ncbi:hypothetical protein OXX79_011537, partial [Metschnikowia pulcherrima]
MFERISVDGRNQIRITMEKVSKLPIWAHPPKTQRRQVGTLLVAIALTSIICWISSPMQCVEIMRASIASFESSDFEDNPDSLCPIVSKLDPTAYIYNNTTLNTILHDAHFRNSSLKTLQRAVQIPTQIYDDMYITEELSFSTQQVNQTG